MGWFHLAQDSVLWAGLYKRGNLTPSSIKCRQFLDELNVLASHEGTLPHGKSCICHV
jgi:hypothetical protein